MAWLAPRLILETEELTFGQICEFDFAEFTQDKYDESKDFLIEKIAEYLEENEETNLINMAKSGGFTDYLKTQLEDKLVE